jgi:ABC-type multidrug transport system fused ATPase/permease subunit
MQTVPSAPLASAPVGRLLPLLQTLWRVLSTQQRRWVIAAQLLSLLMATMTVVSIASIAPFFAALGDPRLIGRPGVVHGLYQWFGSPARSTFQLQLGLTFMAIILLANAINALGTLTMVRLAYRISTDLQSALFGEYLQRPYVFHTRTHSSAILNNVLHETTRVINDVMQNVFLLVTSAATALLIVVSLILLNPLVAGTLILVLAGGYALIYLAMRNWLLRAGERQASFLLEQARVVHDSLSAIREIAVLRLQSCFHGRFARTSRHLGRAQANTLLMAQSPRYIMECVAAMGLVLAALAVTARQQNVTTWLGPLTFVTFACYRLLPTLQQGFSSIVRIRAERARFAAIAPDLQQARERGFTLPPLDPTWNTRPQQQIVLQNVSYRYQPDRPPALRGVTLHIPVHAVVGLIGSNGSGKTTLADVMAGLLEPDSGWLEVDGLTIDDRSRASWQTRIAYVPQMVSLLDASVASNIALGIDAASIDQGRLQQAAQLARLEEFVSLLPGGYQHLIGERGVRLSGGQRQRIGIARALYTGAPLLILDEPTQALDALSEREIMTTILQLRATHTIVLIAHDLEWVRDCDHIYQLDHGRITSSGSYRELLRDSSRVRRIAD